MSTHEQRTLRCDFPDCPSWLALSEPRQDVRRWQEAGWKMFTSALAGPMFHFCPEHVNAKFVGGWTQ